MRTMAWFFKTNLLILLLSFCECGSDPITSGATQGITWLGSTPRSGASLAINCPFACNVALSFSVRVVYDTDLPDASLTVLFLDANGRRCAYAFSPPQNLVAKTPATFSSAIVHIAVVDQGGRPMPVCGSHFTTTTVEIALINSAQFPVLINQASASYTFTGGPTASTTADQETPSVLPTSILGIPERPMELFRASPQYYPTHISVDRRARRASSFE
jgi:hypothetical protein